MNPLDRYPAVRSALYMFQWVANGVLVIAGVVFATLGTSLDELPGIVRSGGPLPRGEVTAADASATA